MKNCVDHKTSRFQIETIQATPSLAEGLSKSATNMEAAANELIERLFFRYNNKDAVPTLETRQNMNAFHHDKISTYSS